MICIFPGGGVDCVVGAGVGSGGEGGEVPFFIAG